MKVSLCRRLGTAALFTLGCGVEDPKSGSAEVPAPAMEAPGASTQEPGLQASDPGSPLTRNERRAEPGTPSGTSPRADFQDENLMEPIGIQRPLRHPASPPLSVVIERDQLIVSSPLATHAEMGELLLKIQGPAGHFSHALPFAGGTTQAKLLELAPSWPDGVYKYVLQARADAQPEALRVVPSRGNAIDHNGRSEGATPLPLAPGRTKKTSGAFSVKDGEILQRQVERPERNY